MGWGGGGGVNASKVWSAEVQQWVKDGLYRVRGCKVREFVRGLGLLAPGIGCGVIGRYWFTQFTPLQSTDMVVKLNTKCGQQLHA